VTTGVARALRRRAPLSERRLWAVLRNRRLSTLKFRRQAPIGRYVVDFVCHRFRLIVEADGPFHDAQRDSVRDDWLGTQGYRVLRFTINMIDQQPNLVIQQILSAAGVPS
jgi:very-short-patch-repair endonuclease